MASVARKPKTEYRIVCSGKGKPWHMQGQNRQHIHVKSSRQKAEDDSAVLNDDINPRIIKASLRAECQPWVIEIREVGQWQTT